MNAPPDADRLRAFLERATRRRATIVFLRASALAMAAATAGVAGLWIFRALTPPTLAMVAAVAIALQVSLALIVARRRGSLVESALAVEQRSPARNLIVTAAELLHRPSQTKPQIVEWVHAHAERRARDINIDRLFAVRRPAIVFVATIVVYGFTSVVLASKPAPRLAVIGGGSGEVRIERIDAIVTPPEYAHKPAEKLNNPLEIRALAGSRVSLSVATNADRVTVETLGAAQTVSRSSDGLVHFDTAADRDGFVALTPAATSARAVPKRLIGLLVDADQAPLVRVDKPGRDLFLASTSESIPIHVSATDDIGLADLRVTYTTVTGSGEDFTFREGDLPLNVAREDGRHWNGSATLALNGLNLAPGDTVVYRAFARDVRPGAPAIESDSFMVHLATPDRAIAGGFTIDDDFNRYAISQQMVIVKTERLIAQKASLSPPAFLEQATEIAAEQRRVRAEFIFMMGGEMEDLNAVADTLDESAEAARESDLAAGRLQNRGAIDLIFATRHMSKAALSLGEPDAPAALKEERAALTALQRAFSKDRYLLRTLSSQQQLDASRRLGGKLTDVARDVRPEAVPGEPPRITTLRSALASIAVLANQRGDSRDTRTAATTLAQRILAIDPTSSALRAVAVSLTNAAGPRLDDAAVALAAVIRNELADASASVDAAANALKGAVADALNHAPNGAIKR